MANIIITGKDYTNFESTYSDLNIIRNINGEEYSINKSEVQNIEIESGNLYLSNENDDYDKNSANNIFLHNQKRRWFLGTNALSSEQFMITRSEDVYRHGTVIANIKDAIINDLKKVSISAKVKYRKYIYNNENYSILKSSTYLSNDMLYKQIIDDKYAVINENAPEYAEDKYLFEADNTIPYDFSRDIGKSFGIETSNIPLIENSLQNFPMGDIQIVDISEANGTTIKFNYKMLIYRGFNTTTTLMTVMFPAFRYTDNKITVYVADSIEFNVKASTIETYENDFRYIARNSQSFATDDPYELESNELMQYTVGQPQDEKISKITADKIFDGTNINRQIVSFDLLNVQKYDFDNSDGTKTRRYLTSRDKIKIKDENDNWVGEYNDDNGNVVVPYFEIIQIENIWDGSFYKRVTAKQVL